VADVDEFVPRTVALEFECGDGRGLAGVELGLETEEGERQVPSIYGIGTDDVG